MDPVTARESDRNIEAHCAICGAPIGAGNLCTTCLDRGIRPEQYVELFWEEA